MNNAAGSLPEEDRKDRADDGSETVVCQVKKNVGDIERSREGQ